MIGRIALQTLRLKVLQSPDASVYTRREVVVRTRPLLVFSFFSGVCPGGKLSSSNNTSVGAEPLLGLRKLVEDLGQLELLHSSGFRAD